MFGSKFRTWMETHIVRPKKKNQRGKEAANGVGVNGIENGRIPPSPHANTILPSTPLQSDGGGCKHSCSSGSGGSGGGGSLEAMLTGGVGAGAPGSAQPGGTSLSSPESAYSTGYSTDGTSPGASFPPEYYINIRTGTHYFHQGAQRTQSPAAAPSIAPKQPQKTVDFLLEKKSPSLMKKELPKRCFPPSHRRSESCDVGRPQFPRTPPPPPPMRQPASPHHPALSPHHITPPVLTASPSPRQRSRIRTNPWLGSTLTPKSGAEDSCNSTCSSGPRNSSSGENRQPVAQQQKRNIHNGCKDSPTVRSPIPIASWSPRRLAVTVSSSSSGSRRSSEDDLTLHEMMGKYDESYVYERETDILSDSDPTDCEDCADTDGDTGLDGGDEQDPDDLDFIDKDSFQDLNLSDSERGPQRLGHAGFYHFPNELSRKLSRHTKRSSSGSRKNVKPRAPRKRRPREPATRSLGGTPVSHRRKQLDDISEVRSHQSPVRVSVQRTLLVEDSRIDNVKRRSNSVSYVSRSCEVRHLPNNNYSTKYNTEIALIEADKEADRKYRELIMEAEHILVSMKAGTPIMGSPRRMLNNPPTNKRVEILRNTECDMVPKNRGSDSIPSTPKLCGSPRFSPKKNHITNFMQINSPELSRRINENPCVNENVYSSPKKLLIHSPVVQRNNYISNNKNNCDQIRPVMKCPNSPRMPRKEMHYDQSLKDTDQLNGNNDNNNSIPGSPILQINGRHIYNTPSPLHRSRESNNSSPILHIDEDSDESTEKEQTSVQNLMNNNPFQTSPTNSATIERKHSFKSKKFSKDDTLIGGTSSSSDGDMDLIKNDNNNKRPPLLTFRSVDIGHKESQTAYCPQSEPVKRKVYSGSATYDRLQKSLDSHNLIRQKSDGETSKADDHDLLLLLQGTDECRAGLREKVAKLRAERIDAEEKSKLRSDQLQQQQGEFQRQLTLFRRQMLLQTIEGLKKSLEDQSASLKQAYDETDVKQNKIESF